MCMTLQWSLFHTGWCIQVLEVVFPSRAALKSHCHYTGCRNVKYFYYFLPTSVGSSALWLFRGWYLTRPRYKHWPNPLIRRCIHCKLSGVWERKRREGGMGSYDRVTVTMNAPCSDSWYRIAHRHIPIAWIKPTLTQFHMCGRKHGISVTRKCSFVFLGIYGLVII